ncbi:hypothetical protein VTI28DRAFT_9165 [Corynascus sepedonium]
MNSISSRCIRFICDFDTGFALASMECPNGNPGAAGRAGSLLLAWLGSSSTLATLHRSELTSKICWPPTPKNYRLIRNLESVHVQCASLPHYTRVGRCGRSQDEADEQRGSLKTSQTTNQLLEMRLLAETASRVRSMFLSRVQYKCYSAL